MLSTLGYADPAKIEEHRRLDITYIGNAGWQITDGKTVILVDPYLSEFRKDAPQEQLSEDDPIARWDAPSIDAHVKKADYILITHGHEDHMLDAPYISKRYIHKLHLLQMSGWTAG